MSDVIYVENDNGLNVILNELETEINPEGYIFVRNGEKEIDSYVQNILKPDLDVYSQNRQNDIENTINTQVDAAVVQLNNFTNSECQTYISQTCQDKKNEIVQIFEQSQDAYASFVDEKNQEVENIVAQADAAAESATSSKNAAASSVTSSSNYSNNSKVWAEGSDSQVQALGGVHSSKGWAEEMDVNNFVHKTGNETIAGNKTFTDNIIPRSVLFTSKTGGANQGFIYQNTSGNLYLGLRNSGNTEFMNNFSFAPDGSITVSIGNSATNKAFIVPNPATSDNSTKAATTAWVRQVAALKDLSNVSSNIDYVVEYWMDGASWFRKFKSGWLEQGGVIQIEGSTYKDITLFRPYINTAYITTFSHTVEGTTSQKECYAQPQSTTVVRLGNACGNSQYFHWTIKGQGA